MILGTVPASALASACGLSPRRHLGYTEAIDIRIARARLRVARAQKELDRLLAERAEQYQEQP